MGERAAVVLAHDLEAGTDRMTVGEATFGSSGSCTSVLASSPARLIMPRGR